MRALSGFFSVMSALIGIAAVTLYLGPKLIQDAVFLMLLAILLELLAVQYGVQSHG